jgi:hypothetical protein
VNAHTPIEPPRRVNELRSRISAAATAHGTTVRRTQALVANVIVSQMLPAAAVKGGTGLKLRFGDALTRETPDLDAAFRGDVDGFMDELNERLLAGWGGFTGRAIVGEKRAPESVPTAYVMQPVAVKLTYNGKPFSTVDLEIGYDELEATTDEEPDRVVSSEVLELFAELGLEEPEPVPVLPLHHQIAQKLHACTEPGSDRAHDLVDLQLTIPEADNSLVASTAQRLFAFRRQHEWPPRVTPGSDWDSKYEVAREGLPEELVRPTATEAASWVNDYIDSLKALD